MHTLSYDPVESTGSTPPGGSSRDTAEHVLRGSAHRSDGRRVPGILGLNSPDDGPQSVSGTIPDIAQVFTMYQLNEVAPTKPPLRQSHTYPETKHRNDLVTQWSGASGSDESADHVPVLPGSRERWEQATSSSEQPHRYIAAEKRARERASTADRDSTYAGMAPAPNRQRSGIGDVIPGNSSDSGRSVAPAMRRETTNRSLVSGYSTTTSETPRPHSAEAEPLERHLAIKTMQSTTEYPPNDASDGSFAAYSRSTSVSSFSQRSHGLSSPVVAEGFSSQALDLVDEGRSKTVDSARVAQWGGPAQLVSRLQNEKAGHFDGGVIEDLRGSTHVLLPSLEPQGQVFALLTALLPIIQSSLVVLDIHNNLLQRLPDGLASCNALEEINVSGNPISEVPVWIGEMVSLHVAILDDCSLRSLPSTLMAAQHLHTICVRRNKLISLPSWLSQLPGLETLLIDGNPFVGPWKTLSETICGRLATTFPEPLARSTESDRSVNVWNGIQDLTIGSDVQMLDSVRKADKSRALGSVPYGGTCAGNLNQSSSKRQMVARSSGSLRRMQSAGALLGLASSLDQRPPLHGTVTTSGIPHSIASDKRRIREDSGSSDEEIEVLTASANENTASDATIISNPAPKSRKWGFLRKMSMGKMRVSSYGNSQTPPPIPDVRGRVSSAPHQESGKTRNPSLRKIDASVTQSAHRRDRGNRRSFLPILEGPPLLNVAIPSFSASPFSISTLSLNGPSDPIGAGPSSSFIDSPTSFATLRSNSSHQDSPYNSAVTYQTGLKSIVSYLGDLYDLSLPVPAVLGGAEVIQSDPGNTSASISVTSEARSGASSPHIGTSTEMNRNTSTRHPNVNAPGQDRSRGDSPAGPMSPAFTERSGVAESQFSPRPPSVAKAADDVAVSTKRYKDDPVVRCGVVRHIIDTERSYVRGLEDLVSIYVRPASQSISKNDGETVIPANERKIVFGGVEGILQFHSQSFLPALEKAAESLLRSKSHLSGGTSQRLAIQIANVFQQYHPFMRQYSSYINNFDYALMRLESWKGGVEKAAANNAPLQTDGATPYQDAAASSLTAGALTAGLGIASMGSTGPSGKGSNATTLSGLTIPQKKRIKTFLKQCRKHPRHSQLNLESYLLLPVQRIPRYRMLLEDLARCTPPNHDSFGDPIEEALQEMVSLASTMNEEKRDSESRRKLVKWQQRIRGRFATPLVQAHRRLLLDGQLTITRNVKRSATLVEVPERMLNGEDHQDYTITSSKSIVQVETLAPEVMERPVLVLLTTDMMLLCKDPSHGQDPDCAVELFAVLKLQTKRKPASVINGNGIRLVDNRNILYLSAPTSQEAHLWVETINDRRLH